jgi:hypothetical protein
MPHPLDILSHLIPWSRKAEAWHTPRQVEDAAVIELAAGLPEFRAHEYPTKEFPEARPQYHVAVLATGERFLVDTQGYDYARYIARLP